TIRREWERAGAYQAVAELFDEIWVFGDSNDTETLIDGGPLAQVASKVHSCGRIGHLEAPSSPWPGSPSGDQKPVVLVTGGGGRDAAPLVRTYMDAVSFFRPAVTSHVVLGPDFPPNDRARLAFTTREGLTVADFVPDLPDRLARSSVIVSMAGYNTVCEILASGRPAVLVPRITPREEQLLRARRWQRDGRIRMIDPRELSPQALWTAVEQLLDAPPVAGREFHGGQVAACRAAALLGGRT
ncbi:MAG: glycosyltransferase, partial [Acidobacteria bacterium]|nr:glycosyltransferase [Acidobacteriota bacterium]